MHNIPSPAPFMNAPGKDPTPYYILNRLLRNPKKYGLLATHRWENNYMLRLGADEERYDSLLFLDNTSALAHLAASWQGTVRMLYAFHSAALAPDALHKFSDVQKPQALESFIEYRLPFGFPLQEDKTAGFRPLTYADRESVLSYMDSLREYGDLTLATMSDSLRFLPSAGYFRGTELKLCCWIHDLGMMIAPTTFSDKERTTAIALLHHVALTLRKMSSPTIIYAHTKNEKFQSLLHLAGFQPQGGLTIFNFRGNSGIDKRPHYWHNI